MWALTITGREKEYVLSGTAENDEVQIRVASSSSVVLSNAVVFTSGRPAVEVVGGNSWRTAVVLEMTGGTSAIEIRNFGDTTPAVDNQGYVFIAGGALSVCSESRAFCDPFFYLEGLTGNQRGNQWGLSPQNRPRRI